MKRSAAATPAAARGRQQPADDKYAKAEATGLQGDYAAIALLMLLYTLQGIPMGLSGAVPLLISGKVTDTEQAAFSVVSWPFSLKLLWAPLVDSIYSSVFGRRKTWIVPAQTLIGVLLLFVGGQVDDMLAEGGSVDVGALTRVFFLLYFLAATQDIAVDGLALTILSERNRELGATCNAIGQSVGYFLAYTIFMAFNSPEFCNSYFRAPEAASPVGLFTLGGFMRFWGCVFVGSTAAVLLARGDEHGKPEGPVRTQLAAAYKEMWLVLQLPAVRS